MSQIEEVLQRIRDANEDFNEIDSRLKDDMLVYLDYYQLTCSEVEHYYGYEEIDGKRIFLQSFWPKEPKAVVLVVHGYFDHTGSMSSLIRYLTSHGYAVFSYDLEGHGLSSGERACIEDFTQYVEVFGEISIRHIFQTSLPTAVIAHSTGAAVVLDCVLRSTNFHKVILLAPLVRSYRWNISRFGRKLIGPLFQSTKRVYRVNSSNEGHLEFVKNDPLQHDLLPFRWLDALYNWNMRMKKQPKSSKKVLVIQGNLDKTVDWRYNCPFIHKKLPNSELVMIDGGDHQLMNESKAIKELTFSLIDQHLLSSP